MTVEQFYEMVMFNQYHNIYVKSEASDEIIYTIKTVDDLMRCPYSHNFIKNFATDWETRFYILWV